MPDRVPTLAEARRALGLSQRQVAQALGVHQRTISQLEHGQIDRVTAGLIDRYLAHLDNLGKRSTAPVPRGEPRAVRDSVPVDPGPETSSPPPQ
jgi:transcriptional regulator with XRE-family HTH domain